MGIVIHDNPQISYPEKIKQEEAIAGTNITYDVSTLISGIQPYGRRQIKLGINILYQDDINIRTTQMFAEHVYNWVYKGSGYRVIELDIIPYHYFLGEVIENHEFITNLLEIGYADIIFTCYPFRISNNPIGEKTFGEINILNDWIQPSSIALPNINNLDVNNIISGDVVSIGAWAKQSNDGTKINRFHLSQLFTIKSVTSSYVTFEENALTIPIESITQRYKPVEFNLMNNGPANILPEVVLIKQEGSNMNGGITIYLDGVYYPMVVQDNTQESTIAHNESFVLHPGMNNMLIYGSGYIVDFVFREERL